MTWMGIYFWQYSLYQGSSTPGLESPCPAGFGCVPDPTHLNQMAELPPQYAVKFSRVLLMMSIFDSGQDLARLTELVTMNSISVVWIGLQTDTEAWRCEGLGMYKACVAILANGNWTDQGCGNTFPFFCYNRSK
uniref:C-type lectin domain-containing protein n=1 Tax=Amphilophus citrinellus TaxID=61819 RepID=A0A3Q0REF4_AMPCI